MIKFPYNILVITFSLLFLLFTASASAMMLYSVATGDPNVRGNVLAAIIMAIFSIPAILAIYVALKKPTPIPFSIDEGTERKILQMAKRHNGRLTATHLAMDSPLTIEQANQILTNFEQRGFAYSAVTTHGGTEYVFPDLLGSTDQPDPQNQPHEFDQPDELDELYNQIRGFERSNKAAREHAELFKSTHKN